MKREFHKRNRLEGYNYSSKGVYFLTLCTEDRKQILSRVVARGILDAPVIELLERGRMVHDAIVFLDEQWESISVLAYVIMPNHVHILLQVLGASGMPRATNAIVPRFVSALKRFTNRSCAQSLWQKSYYDHVIRDEADYLLKVTYIENNPSKWVEDCYFEDGHGMP